MIEYFPLNIQDFPYKVIVIQAVKWAISVSDVLSC